MANNEQAIKDKSRDSANKAKALSPSVQYAMVTVMPNILNGSFWGFDSVKNVMNHSEALKQDQNIVLHKIEDYALIEVEPNFLLKNISLVDPNLIVQSDIEKIKKMQAEANVDFEKFLIRKAKKGNFGGTIGIYCTNDVTTIRYKNVEYPAFRLTINEVLGYLGNYNYSVQINGNFVSVRNAIASGQALWDSMHISPTKTGVFLNIKYCGTAEQGKAFEQSFKQKYGLK